MIRAFVLGMREFLSDCTTHFEGAEIEVYDMGREFMHCMTFRYFDRGSK